MKIHFGTWLRAMTRKAAAGAPTRRGAKRTRPYRIVPRLEALEARCVPSAGISLMPSEPAPQLVGEPITWTATDTNALAATVYQFDVGSPGGPFQVVRDFSPVNQFTWAPMQEGNYRIKVVVKDGFDAADTQSAVVPDQVASRVTGPDAVLTPTANPLVALYSVPPSPVGTVHVEFAVAGANPSWRSTNVLPSSPSRSTNFFVAGMLPSTTYEMRDVFSDGTTSAPLLFTTGAIPSTVKFPSFTVPQPPGLGSDLDQDMIVQQPVGAGQNFPALFATDLTGRVTWYDNPPQADFVPNLPGGVATLVPGGTVLVIGGDSHRPFPTSANVLRETDLASNPLRETNLDAVNAQLTAMGHEVIYSFTHDVQRLPNGQTAVVGLTERTVTINGTPTNYVGDMIVVLDKNFQVTWAWDAFDYLDVNRGPTLGETATPGGPASAVPNLPAVDWLHLNAVSWSPGDSNLVLSIRNQDWVIKVDYANGAGDGHIIWRLGAGGDFAVNSTDPNPWFSHQHDAHYINDSTIILFDDGNVRQASDLTADSRGQVWQLDEKTMTATLVLNADLGNYSMALGSAQRLSNGDYSFDSGWQGQAPKFFAQSIEVRPDGSKSYVLQSSQRAYRSFRTQTLYEGVSDQLTVTNAADDGSAGTLRSEIGLAQSGDTITFDPSLAGQTITLTSGELAITKSLDIEGPGADQLTISGNNASRIFDISGGSTNVTIAGLTIADGLANSTTAADPFGNVTMGGAILNTGAHVTLSHVALDDNQADGTSVGYVQTNLVSDIPGLAQITDPNLKDPWGTAHSTDGSFSIADRASRVSTLYSVTAAGVSKEPLTVAIPVTTFGPVLQGPTGQVANDTASFLVNGTPATFLYSDLNGTIDAWNSSLGTAAQIEARGDPGADYTGMDIGTNAAGTFLYAANTGSQSRVDVFDSSFNPVSLGPNAFVDPLLPVGLSPFNVEAAHGGPYDGDFYVAYAETHRKDAISATEGQGVVAVFDTSGNFIKELIPYGGKLASPWGIVLAPSTFGRFGGDLLVGNFSFAAPEINAFDPATGAYLGTLTDSGGNKLLSNAQGIWDLTFGTGGNGGDPNTLYFTTGLNNENDGLFGAIAPLPGTAAGGAVANVAGGTLDVSHSTFTDNQALGVLGGDGRGGGIDNESGATLTVASSAFTHNRAVGSDADGIAQVGNGLGGALANSGASATIRDSAFIDNEAIGGNNLVGGLAGNGEGGGIENVAAATLTVSDSILTLNRATGGDGFDGGNGQGGGVFNDGTSSLTIHQSLVVYNEADGGAAGTGGSNGLGQGGGLYLTAGGVACADVLTVLSANHASTSDDDLFGILGSC